MAKKLGRGFGRSRKLGSHSSSRRGPSMFQIELASCPPSSTSAYNFPFNNSTNTYNLDSYRPEFSQGRISYQDCQLLVNELGNCNSSMTKCYYASCAFCPSFLLTFFLIPLVVISVFGSRSRVEISPFVLILVLICWIAMLIITISLASQLSTMRLTKFAEMMALVTLKHNETNLRSKGGIAQMSPRTAYVSIAIIN